MDTHLFVGLAGYVGRPEEKGAVGVFRKSITEGTWQHVLDFRDAHVVYVHPNSANYIFAGTDDGIWRSTDKGLTFEKANLPRDGIGIWSFLTSEDDPDVMFAGGSEAAVTRIGFLFRSSEIFSPSLISCQSCMVCVLVRIR